MIIKFKDISKIANKERGRNKKIVTINGSFDIFHSGHLNALKIAKESGDILIVGINSDSSYKKYKDKRGPIINENDRAKLISSLRYVDYVTIFDETTPIEFIKKVKPNTHCNSAGYGKNCVEANTVKEVGAELLLINDINKSSLSTTSIIKKITDRYSEQKIKTIFLDRDGIINEDTGYVYKKTDLKLKDGIIDLLTHLKSLGYIFIIISNQSGIGRGYFSKKQMNIFNKEIIKQLNKRNIKIKKWYICPHNPERDNCDCRKPGSVLFQMAIKENNIDPDKSYSIGDKESDCIAAKRLGITTILVKSIYTKNKKIINTDYKVNSLLDIKNIIK